MTPPTIRDAAVGRRCVAGKAYAGDTEQDSARMAMGVKDNMGDGRELCGGAVQCLRNAMTSGDDGCGAGTSILSHSPIRVMCRHALTYMRLRALPDMYRRPAPAHCRPSLR